MSESGAPTSRILPLREVDSRVKPLLKEMIKYREDHLRPFRHSTWISSLVAGELIVVHSDIQEALNAAIGGIQPPTAFAVPIELLTLEEVVEFDKTELPLSEGEDLLTFNSPELRNVQLFDYALFDTSKRWAVINYHMNFTAVGGDAAFMNAFASRIEGGLDALKRRFIEYCDDWYPSVEFRKKVLAGVGWEDAWQPKE